MPTVRLELTSHKARAFKALVFTDFTTLRVMRVAGIEPTLWQIMSLLHSDQIAKPAQQLVSLTLVPLVPAISACRTQLGINPSALRGLFRPAFHVGEGGGRAGFLCHEGVVCRLWDSSTSATA